MQVTWDPYDIRPGRIVARHGCKEKWMIGYKPDLPVNYIDKYTLNSLADGMVLGPFSQKELADKLNENKDIPQELIIDSIVIVNGRSYV